MTDRFRPWYVLLLIPLVAAIAWVGWRAQRFDEGPQAVLEALQREAGPTLPTDVEGFSSRSAVATYDRDTLHEFADGEADGLLGLGFQRCRVATYAVGTSGSRFVEAAALRFGMPLGAAEAWERERPDGAVPVDGVEGAVASTDVLLVVRGRDVLRLRPTPPEKVERSELRTLALAWIEQRESDEDA